MPSAELELARLGPLELLGKGGQGQVFDAPRLTLKNETGPFVFKEYHERVLSGHETALRVGMGALVEVRLTSEKLRGYLDRYSIWPLAVVVPVRGAPGACGFVMRKLPPTCRVTLTLHTGAKEVDLHAGRYLRSDAEVAKVGLPAMSEDDRWIFLMRAGMLLSTLHDRGVIFGDLSARNIMIDVSMKQGGREFRPIFTDTDGCRIRGTQAPLRQLNTPHWEPPEIREALARYAELSKEADADPNALSLARNRCYSLSMATDVYKFGLLTQRLLHRGIAGSGDLPMSSGPTNVRVSGHASEIILQRCGSARAAVIRRAHTRNPASRPTMRELLTALMGT